RLDVLSRSGEIDVLEKRPHRCVGNAVSAPPLGATGAGVVLCQGKRKRIGLMFPVFDRATQIPRARFQIRLRIEKLVDIEIGDLIFARPLVGRFFDYLYASVITMSAIYSRFD